MGITQLKKYIVGDPLSNDMAHNERISKVKALAVLSSDALSSVAYATEEILIPLTFFAAAAASWSIPIAIAIASLIVIITISYRQTIDAYPNGGGAYTVAKENLGQKAGLVAAASLLIDYTLTVAVSVAAGVENIASAFPALNPYKEIMGVVIILIVTVFNLRGVKDSATVFALPTYLFIFSFAILIVVGGYRLMNGEAVSVAHPLASEVYPIIPWMLLLRAFSSGCSALTGIEAISNGIPIFKSPAQANAKSTMLWMSGILGFLFLGITFLAHAYGIIPNENETVVSILAKSVFGPSFMYYFIQASTALILILAANTSYADFPRLSSLLAKDRFLPRQLASLGDRLVFSNGIIGLSFASILLIILFKGETHHLIPLYAVGVFLSFTLSQLGMVKHHLKTKHPGWIRSLVFNAVGAVTTFVVLTVIGITKFMNGAWMVILLIPLLVILFERIHRHYIQTAVQLAKFNENKFVSIEPARHIAVVPVSGIHQGVYDALRYSISISKNVKACCVDIDPEYTQKLQSEWIKKFPDFELVILPSPYRSVIQPILNYINEVEKSFEHDMVTVVIPEYVTGKWYHSFLHNQTAFVLYAALRLKKNIVVTSVRYHT